MAIDAKILFIDAFTEMMRKVLAINENPIEAYKRDEENKYFYDFQEEMNTLVNTLMHLSKLLSIGLGEAGNKLIIKNLKGNKLNPIIKGEKILAIFGFVYIRYF